MNDAAEAFSTVSLADARGKAWRDLWSAGHGVGRVKSVQPAADVIREIAAEFDIALARDLADPWRAIRATFRGAA